MRALRKAKVQRTVGQEFTGYCVREISFGMNPRYPGNPPFYLLSTE